jgi:flagellar biosynthetic protein FliO
MKMAFKKCLCIQSVLIVLVMFLLVLHRSTNSQTPQNSTGDFDINKVQQALVDQKDSSIGGEVVPVKKKPENYVFVIFRIMFYLGLIIVLIFGIAWFVKKTGITNSSKLGGGGAMDILEALQFGQNRNAILVRVMDTVYLLGQTPTSIVLLEKIEGQKALDLIASSKGGGSVMQFKDAFNTFLGKMKKPV